MEKRYGKRYEGKIVEIACGKHRWRRGTGSAMEDNPGNSLRKASVEERNGKRYGGNIVEIACENHRWRRAAGRDGRCGWERGWEKWKERDGGKIVDIARKKHVWRRGTGRGTCDRACGKHRWRRGTGSAMEEKSWKYLAKSIGGEEMREETDACTKNPTLTNG